MIYDVHRGAPPSHIPLRLCSLFPYSELHEDPWNFFLCSFLSLFSHFSLTYYLWLHTCHSAVLGDTWDNLVVSGKQGTSTMGTLYPMESVKLVERSWRNETTVLSGTPWRLVDHTKCHKRMRPSAKAATLHYCQCPCSHLCAWWYLLKSYMAVASVRSVLKSLPTK